MQGQLQIIPPGPKDTHRLIQLKRVLTQPELNAAVGGFIRGIPQFDSVIFQGEVRLCLAFCDEEFREKRLASNGWANTLWQLARIRRYGLGYQDLGDVLAGPIAIVTGDTAFMEAI
jgi:hypothetical protein